MITTTYKKIKERINKETTLCIISKKRTIKEIEEYYNQGERIFGENKVQELLSKYETLPKDIKWHFIGHLQTNKVKYIASFIDCVQSVDSIKLAKEINKQALKHKRTINILLELHLAQEDMNKTGINIDNFDNIYQDVKELSNLNIQGIMVMGPHTNNQKRIKEVFNQAYNIYKQYNFTTLSMGMSHDYQIALECGSNMLRIGTYLFEEEN